MFPVFIIVWLFSINKKSSPQGNTNFTINLLILFNINKDEFKFHQVYGTTLWLDSQVLKIDYQETQVSAMI